MMLPTEVIDKLAKFGLSEISRNPLGEFAAGDWWQGLLVFSGGASSTVTLIQGAASLPKLARLLRDWNHQRVFERPQATEPPSACVLSYRTATGQAVLDLDQDPGLDQLTEWLSITYSILAKDSTTRR